MRALYWLRRDLRLSDNRILAEAYSRSDEIAAIYIVDPGMLRQRGIDLSHRIFSLVFDALRELNRRIRVHVFMGKTRDVMDELLSKHGFDFLYTASPLSWSEQELAKQVREICLKRGVTYREVLDNVLSNPFQLDPGPNFTSFYRKWLEKIDTKIAPEVPADKFIGLDEPDVEEFARKQGAGMLGEDFLRASWGRERLRSFDFSRYSRLKDYPCEDGTSKLSPFLSLGILSVREVYRAVKRQSREYVRQLAWREYYYSLWAKYPWMNKLELKPQLRDFEWSYDEELLKSFTEGKTGYPIVDAGIRQLKKEGWVHNRVRLIVASFLVKDLHLDWRTGEEFFGKHLVDYDEVLNVGNWQWAASVGVDPLPLRIFNPIQQSKKYDPNCFYIKRYIPELRDYDCESLHNPLKRRIGDYYEPIIDHYEQVRRYKELVMKRLQRRER